jgi:UDP-3-O-[3-hydroxymyristoyl] N-acetylglucosamine deacetylase
MPIVRLQITNRLFVQQTLKNTLNLNSIGLHSGKPVSAKLKPARTGTGIVFKRVDLKQNNFIPAFYNNVVDTRLSTTIANSFGAKVSTIEHLMAAIYACKIDNLIIEIDNIEVPIYDGSSKIFVDAINQVGVIAQDAPYKLCIVKKPIRVEKDGKYIELIPASEFAIDCTIDFTHPLVGKQNYIYTDSLDSFANDVASARTFGFYEELEMMRAAGLGLGASLDNAVALKKDGTIMNEGGFRYHNEPVRHKILDCIGDLALAGSRLICHVRALKCGHELNNLVLRELFSSTDNFDITECSDLSMIHTFNDFTSAAIA